MARPRTVIDLARVEELAREGHTDANIARLLGVSQDTITRRKQDFAGFADAIERGRQAAHSDVSNALWRQAKRGNVAAITWYEKTRRGMSDTITHKGDSTAPLFVFTERAPADPGGTAPDAAPVPAE